MIEIGDFTTTSVVLIIISVLAIVWDVYLWRSSKATISQVIRLHSFRNPVYPFIAGFLCGHWFW